MGPPTGLVVDDAVSEADVSELPCDGLEALPVGCSEGEASSVDPPVAGGLLEGATLEGATPEAGSDGAVGLAGLGNDSFEAVLPSVGRAAGGGVAGTGPHPETTPITAVTAMTRSHVSWGRRRPGGIN